MITQHLHKLSSSFALWTDYILLKRGFAYENKTGVLINYDDERIPSPYEVFGSPHKQWVSDSSITGAVIPSGVYVGGSFLGRSSGIILDYDNGRILGSGVLATAAVTGSYSAKEFNVYATNQDEEGLIVEKVQETANQKVGTSIETTYLTPYEQKLPAVFINVQTQENKPFSFGGLDRSVSKVNIVALTQDPYQLDGVLSLFADTGDDLIKEIPFDSDPYTEQGDLKNNSYNYETLAAQSSEYYTVESVKASKATDSLRRGLGTQLYIGFIDFEVSKVRQV